MWKVKLSFLGDSVSKVTSQKMKCYEMKGILDKYFLDPR